MMRKKKTTLDTEKILQGLDKIHFKSLVSEAEKEIAYTNILSRIRSENTGIAGVSRIWKYVAFAASFALLVVLSYVVRVSATPEKEEFLEVMAIAGSKSKVVLPDSSVVWLNSNAWIRYPRHFSGKSRIVEFAGDALFDVAKQAEVFIVKMPELSLNVLGTTFNIHSDIERETIEVTLENGKVALYRENNTSIHADQILIPNDQALYYRNSGEIEVKQVNAPLYSSWHIGTFVFENNTLSEIARILDRAFDIRIHIRNSELREKRFTARFTNQETLDEILSILQISAKYSYRKEKGEIYINPQ